MVYSSSSAEIRLGLLLDVAKSKGGFCRRVYFLTTYTVLIRTSQQGCEALSEDFLVVVLCCRSFEIINERYSLVRGSEDFLQSFIMLYSNKPS